MIGKANEDQRLRLGVAYYPEQWPESRREKDAGLMASAGITTVRLAEFAWHKFEPVEGKYDTALAMSPASFSQQLPGHCSGWYTATPRRRR